MNEHELNSFLYRTLAQSGDWMTFDQLDRLLAKAAPELRCEVRRSMLRGELGRMIRNGSILRDKRQPSYRIGDDVNLFDQTNN